MRGRDAELFRHRLQACRETSFNSRAILAPADQQARAGDRGERHGALQFWIVAAPGALERIRPAVVEDIFALAVRFEIARHRAQQPALRIFQPQVMALPAGAPHGAAGIL